MSLLGDVLEIGNTLTPFGGYHIKCLGQPNWSRIPGLGIPVAIGGIGLSLVETISGVFVAILLVLPALFDFKETQSWFVAASIIAGAGVIRIALYILNVLWGNTLGLLCTPCLGIPGIAIPKHAKEDVLWV